jgi:hypothetical protein
MRGRARLTLLTAGFSEAGGRAGVGFYVCCAIARTPIEQASRAMLPYLVVLIAGLLIVAFVPWFTLSLPNALGFRG